MASGERIIKVYEQLAECEEQKGSAQMRDRFLILAADAALTHGHRDEAEKLRGRLLEHNPHHLLRPYHSLAEAMKSSDVYSYVVDLRNTYPPEEAERLLGTTNGAPASAEPEPVHNRVETLPDPEPTMEQLAIYPISHEPAVEDNLFIPPAAPQPVAKNKRKITLLPEGPLSEAAELAPPPPPPEKKARRRKPRPAEDQETEPPSAVTVWISTILFVMLLLAALALGVWTLARPFLHF